MKSSIFVPPKTTVMTELDKKIREKEIYKITLVGSFVNFLLVVFKFLAGIAGHSAAMLADAVHSLSDFITDVVVILFVRISNKPVDKSHDYGYGKYETLATALIGMALLGVGLGILWNGATEILAFLRGDELRRPEMLAWVAAVISVLFKEMLYRYTVRAGKKHHSQVVVANAWHHRSDALSSIGTAVGIGGSIWLGSRWAVLDPVAAVVVSFFIMRVAVRLLIPCWDELSEKSLPDNVEHEIERIVLSFDGVSEPHHLRTRRIGNKYAIEIHIRMDGDIPLHKAHSTATGIEHKLKEKFGEDTHVGIHVEPVKQDAGNATDAGA